MKKLTLLLVLSALLSGCATREANINLNNQGINRDSKSIFTDKDKGDYHCGTDLTFNVSGQYYWWLFIPVYKMHDGISYYTIAGEIDKDGKKVQVWQKSFEGTTEQKQIYVYRSGGAIMAYQNNTGLLPSLDKFIQCSK
ncbi:hypothetical protein L8O47_10740 [Enterobacter roggenkampii]|uniref:hypothetical protein n=1 Tax=Enterobacter roggenkampii TaxID=1812935 RepID=UPI002004E5BD|nr:hypothetical protein [Enterobacter roggenkampii]MCK7151384.1 hypothetical protein [Enterobacter roggenkampii]